MINYSIQLNNNEFKNSIDTIISQNVVDEIIETGTFLGNGSTKIFAETGKYVFSIECNYHNWAEATNNLINHQNVCVVHGLSMKREELIKEILNEKFDIETVYDSKYPKSFYMREIFQHVLVEDSLELYVNNDRNQIVFLDSAGGVGYLEFKKVMKFSKEYLKHKILVLDDVSHIKHIRSVEFLKSNGFNVIVSSDERFAWCSFQDVHNQKALDFLT